VASCQQVLLTRTSRHLAYQVDIRATGQIECSRATLNQPAFMTSSSPESEQTRLSISLSRPLHKRLKLYAHENDSTLSALVIQLIKAEISRSEQSPLPVPPQRPT
jgi:macrodomain Ter protein organizer (MatP/YcbG family)